MKLYEIPGDIACPACRGNLSFAKVERGAKRGPKPDDQTVCGHCLTYLRYVETEPDQLGLELISQDQFNAMPEVAQSSLMQARGQVMARQQQQPNTNN